MLTPTHVGAEQHAIAAAPARKQAILERHL